MSSTKLRINFIVDDSCSDVVKKRVYYTFDIFCSVFRIKRASDGIVVKYGCPNPEGSMILLVSSPFFVSRDHKEPPQKPNFIKIESEFFSNKFGVDSVPLFTVENEGQKPDWLSEAFEWMSLANEYSLDKRDSIGRVDYKDTLFGKYNLDPKIPYASIALFFLYKEIFGEYYTGEQAENVVGLSHDIDYLPITIKSLLIRNAKYSVIQLLRKEYVLSLKTVFACLFQFAFKNYRIGGIKKILEQEGNLGVQSTYFFILSKLHRRDANYMFSNEIFDSDVKPILEQKNEVGIHGSYTSMFEKDLLDKELVKAERFGLSKGFRAHWLRFPCVGKLISVLEKRNTFYDSSLGFSCKIGFRSGANFPHPFYNFETESASSVKLLPLAIMDGALNEEILSSSKEVQELIGGIEKFDSVVKMSGYSVLWHNTALVGTEFSSKIKDAYWTLIKRKKNSCMTCLDVVRKFEGLACE